MKKILVVICFLFIFSGCDNKSEVTEESSKEVSSSGEVKKKVEPPVDKLGFTSETILDSNFNELIKDDFSVIDTYKMNSGSKVEVLSNDYKVVKVILFTNENEDIPSAFTVTAPKKSNSTIDKKYDDSITVLKNSIPETNLNFITEFNSILNKNKFNSVVFNDDFLQSDLEVFFKDFLKRYTPESKSTEMKEEEIPVDYGNAFSSAKKYLKVSSFSKNKLKNQLIHDKFSEDAAAYAVDNVTTDWNENAIDSAKKYLKLSDFSKEKLYDQLIHDEYTSEEARQAVDKTFN